MSSPFARLNRHVTRRGDAKLRGLRRDFGLRVPRHGFPLPIQDGRGADERLLAVVIRHAVFREHRRLSGGIASQQGLLPACGEIPDRFLVGGKIRRTWCG